MRQQDAEAWQGELWRFVSRLHPLFKPTLAQPPQGRPFKEYAGTANRKSARGRNGTSFFATAQCPSSFAPHHRQK